MKKRLSFILMIGFLATTTMFALQSCSDRDVIIEEPIAKMALAPEELDADSPEMISSTLYINGDELFYNYVLPMNHDIDYVIIPELRKRYSIHLNYIERRLESYFDIYEPTPAPSNILPQDMMGQLNITAWGMVLFNHCVEPWPLHAEDPFYIDKYSKLLYGSRFNFIPYKTDDIIKECRPHPPLNKHYDRTCTSKYVDDLNRKGNSFLNKANKRVLDLLFDRKGERILYTIIYCAVLDLGLDNFVKNKEGLAELYTNMQTYCIKDGASIVLPPPVVLPPWPPTGPILEPITQ